MDLNGRCLFPLYQKKFFVFLFFSSEFIYLNYDKNKLRTLCSKSLNSLNLSQIRAHLSEAAIVDVLITCSSHSPLHPRQCRTSQLLAIGGSICHLMGPSCLSVRYPIQQSSATIYHTDGIGFSFQ